jgi:hypothetical protein
MLGARTIALMTDFQGARVLVELDPFGEPISGCVTDGRGRRRTFSGWLDLMDVLDHARYDAHPTNDVRTHRGVHHPAGEEATE